MNNKTQSMEVYKEWISKLPMGYEKKEGSSYEGFIYKVESITCHKNFVVDVRFTKDAIKFEMYPGINACSKDFIPMMAKYCLEAQTRVGYLHVDEKANEVAFVCETFFVDNPITTNTISRLEKIGKSVLERHYETLSRLAAGDLIIPNAAMQDCDPNDNEEKEHDEFTSIIRDALKSDRHRNSVCESVTPNGQALFYLQNYTESEAFVSELSVNDGFLVMRGCYGRNGILCPPEYRKTVAEYLREFNDVHMLGGLKLGLENEPIHYDVSCSLLDGRISEKTIDLMEAVLINALSDTSPVLQKMAFGFPISEDDEAAKADIKSIISEALSSASKRFDKLPDQNAEPGNGFLSFLNKVAERRKMLEQDNEPDNVFTPEIDEDETTMDEFKDILDSESEEDDEEN